MHGLKFSVLFFLITTSSFAQAALNSIINERLSINASLGYLTGESKEFVYDDDTSRKISELIWKINGEAVLRGEANYKIFDWLDANAQGWVSLVEAGGVMDDYDWFIPGQMQWTHWSHHDNTRVKQANEFDLNLRAWFLRRPNYQLAGLLGYQRTLFSYEAIGGCFSYENGADVGCFYPGDIGIGYKQIFKSPYIGIGGKYIINLFELNGFFKFSNQVDGNDVDQHYSRYLTFTESASHSKYYNLVLNAGYYVKPQLKFFAEGAFTYFPNKLASTTILDNTTGETFSLPVGSAGLQNKNLIIALGVQYNV